MGETLEVLIEAVGIQPLDGGDDLPVQGAPLPIEQAAVRHLVGQRVLERVLHLGKQTRLVEELRGLKVSETAAKRVVIDARDRSYQGEGHVLPDDGGALKHPLLLGG